MSPMLDTARSYTITETRVDKKLSIESVINWIRSQRMTAHVNIQLIDGGIHEVIVTEKRKLNAIQE